MKLTITTGSQSGKTTELGAETLVIGREDGCDLTLDDQEVSRRHAEIRRRADGGYEIADLDSRNGTLVDGKPISAPTELKGGEKIQIGETELTTEAPKKPAAATETRIASTPDPITLLGTTGPGKGTTLTPTPEGITIGRDEGADVVIDDAEVSRKHAEIRRQPDFSLEIRDLGSRNGTTVNGKTITGPTALKGGEEVGIGQTSFRVNRPGAEEGGKTEIAGRPAAVVAPPAAAAKPPAAPAQRAAPAPAAQGPVAPAQSPRAAGQGGGGGGRTGLIIAAVAGAAVLIVAILAVAGVFSGSSGPPSATQIIDNVKPSTVLVTVNSGGQRIGNGSGWVYDANKGLIVTNAHVVSAGSSFQVGINNELRSATVVGVAPCSDLAVLKVNRTAGLKTLELGSQADLQQGDPLFAIGYPLNASLKEPLQVTQGIVSVVKTRLDAVGQVDPDFLVYPNVIQTDAAINPGNSGGPSVNEQSQLIGVNTAGGGSTQNQNYAIGVDEVKKIVPKLATGNSIGWAGFGFKSTFIKGVDHPVIEVESVIPNTDAANIGMAPGQFVISVNGKNVETRQDYCNAVETVQSGETVPIEVFTSTGDHNVRITFG